MRNARLDMGRSNRYEALFTIETCHSLLCCQCDAFMTLLFGNLQQMQQQRCTHALAAVFG